MLAVGALITAAPAGAADRAGSLDTADPRIEPQARELTEALAGPGAKKRCPPR